MANLARLLSDAAARHPDRPAVRPPVVYYAVLRAGGTAVPMNVLLTERETSFYLTDPGASLVVAWADVAHAAQAGAKAVGAFT